MTKSFFESSDAILYLGTIVPHYRVGAYEGDEYAQFFYIMYEPVDVITIAFLTLQIQD